MAKSWPMTSLTGLQGTLPAVLNLFFVIVFGVGRGSHEELRGLGNQSGRHIRLVIETSKRLPLNRAGPILFSIGTARNKNLHVFYFQLVILRL